MNEANEMNGLNEIPEATEATAVQDEASSSAEAEAFDGLETLRCELAEIKTLLVAQKQVAAAAEPTVGEAFRALYPDVSEEEIPDAVWEAARGGLPLEAAYALHERREALRRSAADRINRRNANGAWGRADTEMDGFLSPDEVREMTPDEVRKNYARIMESMKHWN